MITKPKQYAYKRLETDVEFRARLDWSDHEWLRADALDAEAWRARKMQRRIVDGES